VRTVLGTALSTFIAVASLGPALPYAAAAEAPITGTRDAQPLVWLKSRDFAAVEQHYSQLQREYESGRVSDQQLYGEFRKLYEDSMENAWYFDEWVRSYPSSYSALLARGAYLYRMAWSVRGDKYLTETARGQISAMENYLALARPDLLASLQKTAKPYLSTLYLLNAAMLQGSAAEREHWFEQGVAIDPANTLVRLRYMFSLRPRWGGSYAAMQHFLQSCEAQHLDPALLARLAMLIHADVAEDAMRAGDTGRVLSEWEQVLELAQSAHEEPSTEALVGYTRAAWDLHRRADADRGLEQLSRRDIDDGWSLARIGWIYTQEHRDKEAWPMLQRAASLSDAWAQFVVGNTTYRGSQELGLPPDQASGLIWIKRAADQCFPDATTFLTAHGQPVPADCASASRTRGSSSNWSPAWAALTKWGLGSALTTLILGWMAASRHRARPAGDAQRLMHPFSTLIVGLVGLAFFIFLATASNLYTAGSANVVTTAVFVGFAVLSLATIAEYFFVRHELTPDGIEYGRLSGARGTLKWSEVTRVTYSAPMRWYRLESSSGQVVRISALLTGLPEFARAVLAGVPFGAIDESAAFSLQSAAQGALPRVYG
jgi:tetratricopeptide (TPR) repeat protein